MPFKIEVIDNFAYAIADAAGMLKLKKTAVLIFLFELHAFGFLKKQADG